MHYHLVIWKNNSLSMPKLFMYEVGEHGYETRKIEIFDEGKIGYAYDDVNYCECTTSSPTGLSDQPSPQVIDYNRDSVFFAIDISKEEFEIAWEKFGPRSKND